MGSFSRRLRRQASSVNSTNAVPRQVAELRRLMLEAQDLSDIHRHFAQLSSDSTFMALGRPADNGRLGVMARAAARVVVEDTTPTTQALIYLEEYELWHGVIVTRPGAMVTVVYFAEDNRGMCSVIQPPSSRVDHMRFSIPEEIDGSADVKSIRLVHSSRRPAQGEPH